MTSSNVNARSAPGWQNYVNLNDDVKPWLALDLKPDPNIDAKLRLVTSMACDMIQNKLGRPIPPTDFTYRFDGWSGWNGAFLELPYYPIIEVTSVIEYWGVSGPHVLTESSPTAQVDGWQCEYPVGRLIRVFPGNVQKPWFPGSRNVEVHWKAGYDPIPSRYLIATLELIKHWWTNTQQNAALQNSGVGIGNEYDPANTSGVFAGIPYHVASILDADIQVGLG